MCKQKTVCVCISPLFLHASCCFSAHSTLEWAIVLLHKHTDVASYISEQLACHCQPETQNCRQITALPHSTTHPKMSCFAFCIVNFGRRTKDASFNISTCHTCREPMPYPAPLKIPGHCNHINRTAASRTQEPKPCAGGRCIAASYIQLSMTR